MTLKSYLWGIGVGTIFALAGWVLVIFKIDPEYSGAVGKSVFHVAGFLFFFGFFSFLLGLLRKGSFSEGIITAGTNLRQGLLLSILTVSLIFMQGQRILVWWDALLVAAGIFLIELYFLTHRR